MGKSHEHSSPDSQHGHSQHGHHEHGHKDHGHSRRRGVHKDWRLWAGVILMLAAMAVYVLTKDESLRPGAGPAQPAMPAAP